MRLSDRIVRRLMPPPVRARHAEYSMIFAGDDDPAQPSETLLDLALDAASRARAVRLDDLCARMARPPFYPAIWPGEHYRLLAGIVQSLRPQLVLDIGTFQGLSALAMRPFLPEGARLYSFDIIDWRSRRESYLRDEDLEDPALQFLVEDLTDPAAARARADLLRGADFLFVDAAKDGVMEQRLMERFREVGLREGTILAFDDIRVWNMLRFWREIAMPKLDVTSLGHWSGTGLVEWRATGGGG